MRYYFLLYFIIISIPSLAQSFKYIGPEEGLSNRRVYHIEKDQKGFMWFLTREGIDRYDGKNIKNYKLQDGFDEVKPIYSQCWMHTDGVGNLYVVGNEGRLFKYDNIYDLFKIVYRTPKITTDNDKLAKINYSFINPNNTIWLCTDKFIYIWNIATKRSSIVANSNNFQVKSIAPINETHYFIGTNDGLHYAELINDSLKSLEVTNIVIDNQKIPVSSLYYDKENDKLLVGTPGYGITVIKNLKDLNSKDAFIIDGTSINSFEEYINNQLLISTDGNGVYIMNKDTEETKPFLVTNHDSEIGMNGNTIKDLLVDEENRIWMCNFPMGVTIYEKGFSNYKWIKHSIGNRQSIVNNRISAITKDSEGDIWFATSNGISLYKTNDNSWHSFYSSFDNHNNTCIQFLSINEVSPGVIWTTGYDSEIYSINKKDFKTNTVKLNHSVDKISNPDSYIRSVYKDSESNIWLGGEHRLRKVNPITLDVELYDIPRTICIIEKDHKHLWIGTMNGLFLLNKNSKELTPITIPAESNYIYSLLQNDQGQLYIGTSGSGLLIYSHETNEFNHFHTNNTSLISNSICTILSNEDYSEIIIGTENGLTRFYPNEKRFRNWTKDQGLKPIYYNSSSGVYCGNNYYILGTNDGAILFERSSENPKYYKNKMVLSDFRLFYETVYPGDKNSPLINNIDDTKSITLNHNQNIFSLEISSINYTYPSDVLYTWKLEGFYNKWRRLGKDNIVRYTNLSPGKYKLHIRAVSNENKQIVLEERSIDINIKKPIWKTIWAYIIYCLLLAYIAAMIMRFLYMRKQKDISNEKIQFFINSAHDIRTPLTLIKAPLEEIREKELLTHNGMSNVNVALRNVNSLLRLTTNLINFERTDVYSSDLYISENELNSYITDIFQTFRSFANSKDITFTYESNFKFLNVWFDKDKMDSVLKNIISNALKYTPNNGEVHIIATESNDNWTVEVQDTGIGVPASEQKRLFKTHFRGSNAVNSKITGSGIGLMLAWKLVRLHGGKTQFSSVESKGSSMKITIPKKSSKLNKAHIAKKSKDTSFVTDIDSYDEPTNNYQDVKQNLEHENQRILIVEDNDELRTYLKNTLSEVYIIQTCENGKDALTIIKEYKPNLIISDIMMPELRGDELCKIVKSNIETSHIPVILLTALSDEKSILDGINIGADEYITKPFNIGILKATITNILTNRALLNKKYTNFESQEEEPNINYTSDIDWKFIAAVKKSVEDNMDNQAFNVDILCNLLNMSRTSFYNKIKALTNQAPADYVRLIRLNRAAALLKERKYSIIEIAEMTGFNDAKYFREVFKKHFKVSPSKYAKEDTEEKAKKDIDKIE